MRGLPVVLVVGVACRRDPVDPPVTPPEARRPTTITPADAGAPRCPSEGERWTIDATPAAGEPCIDVVRIDPVRHPLAVYTDKVGRTADAWREAEQLTAVINAGMFHAGGAPVGLIVDRGRVRGTDNPKFGGFLAWDPIDPHDPPLAITARQCAGFDLAALRTKYRSLIQSYRLLDCDGGALPWQDPKQYSAAAIGVDRAGLAVLLHARGAVTMAELSTALAGHDLVGVLFLEGGPEATLVAGALSRVGSYETGFVEHDDNHTQWALPNVLGFR